jgi:hypothetical protein
MPPDRRALQRASRSEHRAVVIDAGPPPIIAREDLCGNLLRDVDLILGRLDRCGLVARLEPAGWPSMALVWRKKPLIAAQAYKGVIPHDRFKEP